MRLLLDTHVLVWTLGEPAKLPERVVGPLVDPDNEVFVSAVSAWEIAVKRRLGKLDFDSAFLAAFDARVRDLGFAPLGLTSAEMIRGAEIDAVHKDPFDRMLAGQAIVGGLTVVTADPAIVALGAQAFWRD